MESIPRPIAFLLFPLLLVHVAVCAHRIRLLQQTSRLGNRLLPEKSCLATAVAAAHMCVVSLSLSLQLLTNFFCQHRYSIAGNFESHSSLGGTSMLGLSVPLMDDQSVCQSDLCRRACIIVQIYFNQRGIRRGLAEIHVLVWSVHHSNMLLKSDH